MPVCAVCEDGYTAGLGRTCSECSAERRSATITAGAILVAVVVAAVVRGLKALGTGIRQSTAIESFFSGNVSGDGPRAKARQSLKIIVVSWQIITQASSVSLSIHGNRSQPYRQAPYFVCRTLYEQRRLEEKLPSNLALRVPHIAFENICIKFNSNIARGTFKRSHYRAVHFLVLLTIVSSPGFSLVCC